MVATATGMNIPSLSVILASPQGSWLKIGTNGGREVKLSAAYKRLTSKTPAVAR